ncbi:PAS domain S-box protein [Deinococcus apachensis]|uniref:PAS domain S-box protein n=1 Tax=Deinococcus apachensis TaxID=309886 RepID=UPI00037EE1FF|nr:PAS domain S-box protein [Deinococcus apachensis]
MTIPGPLLNPDAHHLLDSLADPFFVVDGEWRYTYVNAHAAGIMGVTPPDLLGKVLWECFPEALDTRLEEEYRRVMTAREVRQFELHYPALQVWVEVKAFPHEGGIAVHFRDITARRLADERREALLAVTLDLARASTEREVAATALLAGLPVLGAYGGTVLRVTGQGDGLELVHSHGYADGRSQSWHHFPMSTPLPITDAVRNLQAVFMRERDLLARYPALGPQKSDRTRALAALPLIVDGRALGALALSFDTDRTFNQAERDFAVSLAGQLAQALARASLQETQARSAQRLRGLAAAALNINAARTLDETLDVITEQARAVIGAHQAVVSLSVGDDWAQAINAVSLSDKYAAWREYQGAPDGSGLYARVCRLNTPLRLTRAELEAHPAWQSFGADADRHPPMRGWLAVPLVGRGGQNIGLIQLSDKTEGDFTAEDESILVQLAQLAAGSVENARAVQSVRDSEARYRSLVEASSQMVWTTPPSGEFEGDQPAWRNFTGQTTGELQGRGWLQAVHLDDRPQVLREWNRAHAAKTLYQVEYRLRRADGEYRHMLVRVVPVKGEDGEVREWVGTHTDITERKAAQAALQERDAELRAMIDTIPQLAWMADPQGWIYWYNQRWYDYTGTTFEQMQGWGWRDVHHPGHIGRVLEDVSAKWAAGQPWEGTFLLRSRDGEYRWFLTRAIPLWDERGELVRWFGTNTDITDERHLNETLEARVAERTEQLLRSNRELEQFAYVASHDLKAPLRTVASYVQLLQRKYRGQLDDQADRYIAFTVDAVERMNVLIDDVLAYSRVGREMRVSNVNTGRVLREVLENLEDALQERGARVTSGDLPSVRGDETQLRQVLQNLIGNAIKFQPAGRIPEVHLSAEVRGDVVQFTLRDNGIGIAAQHFGRIFGVFQRLHRREEFNGTGVGLAIVKKIVEEHGGHIWVESQEGVGTAFHFTFPAAETEEA